MTFFLLHFYFNFNVTPLYCAIKNENIEIVNLLLKNVKIDVNASNKSLMNYADDDGIRQFF